MSSEKNAAVADLPLRVGLVTLRLSTASITVEICVCLLKLLVFYIL